METRVEDPARVSEPARGRVLVVDDEEPIRRLWIRVLERAGFQVDSASAGDEAVAKLAQNEYAVVFTDFCMPGMGGLELLKHVKESGATCCVNIITGVATIEGAVQCVRLGACDYVAKPCAPDELSAIAERCANHARERREVGLLRQSIRRHEELDRLKSEFVSNVSHELRTPLFAMGAAMDLLLEGAPEDATPEGKLRAIVRHNYVRLCGVIGNVLDFSRLERGTLKPKFQDTDIAALAARCLSDMQALCRRQGLTCAPLAVEGNPPAVSADPDQAQQVFVNLLGNAMKFTRPGGSVGITVSDAEGEVRVCVWDTGRGIPVELQGKIFERFYQVDSSITREVGGSGIGLSIVQGIMELHGGRVWVESEPEKGSRFFAAFPKRTGGTEK